MWLCQVSVAARGISDLPCSMQDFRVAPCQLLVAVFDKGLNPGPLHWEHRVLATGHQGGPYPQAFISATGKATVIDDVSILGLFSFLLFLQLLNESGRRFQASPSRGRFLLPGGVFSFSSSFRAPASPGFRVSVSPGQPSLQATIP